MIRKILFWGHLIAGLITALVLTSVAATGVLLTYERQMTRAAEDASLTEMRADGALMTADALVTAMQTYWPEAERPQLVIDADGHAPVRVFSGRRLIGLLNPYTGDMLENKGTSTKAFFADVRSLHRWLLQSGDGRQTGRLIVGISTIVFAVMIITGVYLWFPKTMTRKAMRPRIWFRQPTKTTQAKHFTWHHSFAFWTWPILLARSISGLAFGFKGFQNWLSDVGDDWASAATSPVAVDSAAAAAPTGGPFAAMIRAARSQVPNAQRIHIYMPANGAANIDIRADAGSGAEPAKRVDMSFDVATAALTEIRPFSTTPPGRRTIIWLRYLHTGEYYGLIGQTLAGLVCIAMLFLIYSGTLLGIKRLWAMRRKSSAVARA